MTITDLFKIKKALKIRAFLFYKLTVTYSHIGRPYTTIGAIWFHF